MPYDVEVQRLPIFALFDLKGAPDALSAWAGPALPAHPAAPNTRSGDTDILCHIGPNRWLLRAALDREAELDAALRPAEAPPDISIVRVSDTLTFFRLTGPDAESLLSIGCPLDVHPKVFGPDAVTYTELFGLKALVLRCKDGFEIAVEQSFADMVADYIARAMA